MSVSSILVGACLVHSVFHDRAAGLLECTYIFPNSSLENKEAGLQSFFFFLDQFDRCPGSIRGKRIGGVTNKLTEAVNYLFHHTTLNATQLVAHCLTDYNIQVTICQIRTIRSSNCRLRASTGQSKAAQRATTLNEQFLPALHGPLAVVGSPLIYGKSLDIGHAVMT